MASSLAHYRASPVIHPSSSAREQVRDLPPFSTMHSVDDVRHSMPSLDPISRPSSTSTQNSSLHHSASLPQLPGLSALASLASTSNPPQLRYVGGRFGAKDTFQWPWRSWMPAVECKPLHSYISALPTDVPPRQLCSRRPRYHGSVWGSSTGVVLEELSSLGSPGMMCALVYLEGHTHHHALQEPFLPISKPRDPSILIFGRPGVDTSTGPGKWKLTDECRALNVGPTAMNYSSPSATSGGGQGNSPPICGNCATSTTPLWRRDEVGSVLCNACGLFLKLHGRPRPISLKTDVIKSRNRVKSSGTAHGAKKKASFETNGLELPRSQAGTPPPGTMGHRRTSQKSANGHSDGSNSPISRTATPSMYTHGLPPFSGHLEDHYNHHSPSLPPLHLRQLSPGRSASPLNGAHGLEVPQTYEQLIASNSSLKTRVSELEVINELFRGRVSQLEQDENNARRGEEMRHKSEQDLMRRLEESQRRENQLKHRLDDVEAQLSEMRDGAPPAKKMRLSDMVGESESSTPQSIST
ncbi:hypothetical protein JHW43_000834 [Diplocarpon mali]|nr:hypothetical protein JHW43_000834 [Diplocarpon mali]